MGENWTIHTSMPCTMASATWLAEYKPDVSDIALVMSFWKHQKPKIIRLCMIKCPRQVFLIAPGNNGNENRPWRFYQIKINVKLSRKTLMFTLDHTSPKTMATDLWFVLLLQTWSVCVRWKNYRNIDVVRSHLSKSVGEKKKQKRHIFYIIFCLVCTTGY